MVYLSMLCVRSRMGVASKISHAQSRAPLQEILGPPLRTTTLAKSSSSYYSGHPPNDMATGREEEYEKFDPLAFLEMRYRKTTDYYRFSFPLQEYHSFFTKTFSGNGKALKVLDYGCGPVLMYVISAVPFASEIIMADIVPECLDEIKKWIQNDPLRHVKDWDPRDNDIHSMVPAHRTAISQIDEFHTENPVHT